MLFVKQLQKKQAHQLQVQLLLSPRQSQRNTGNSHIKSINIHEMYNRGKAIWQPCARTIPQASLLSWQSHSSPLNCLLHSLLHPVLPRSSY